MAARRRIRRRTAGGSAYSLAHSRRPHGVPDGGLGLAGPRVEGVGVVAGQLCRTGEGFDDALAERLLQGGQALVAQA